ncbi:MAG: hypothetical protein EOO41_05235, partial [Methanobacteriota archaeon]
MYATAYVGDEEVRGEDGRSVLSAVRQAVRVRSPRDAASAGGSDKRHARGSKSSFDASAQSARPRAASGRTSASQQQQLAAGHAVPSSAAAVAAATMEARRSDGV